MAGKGSKEIARGLINYYKINRNGYPYEIIYKLSRLIQTLEDVHSVSNATELQEAIDSIGDGAGTIFFASGTHTISSTVNINTGGTIIVYGHGDNTILKPDAGVDVFSVTDGMVIIEKLKLDLSNYIADSKGIIINETNDKVSIIDNITITGDGVNGIGIELSSNNCRINNCNINNIDYGINVLSNDNILSGNNCDNCATYGVNIDGDYNNLIANIIDTNGVGINLTINADSNRIRENKISGNTIQWTDNGINNDIEYRCTTATDIQDAVDSIGDKSGVVVLINKTYTLTGIINLNGGGLYFIRGEGEGSIIDCAGDRSAFNITSAKEGTTLSHFKIDANDLTSLLKEIINVNEGSDNKIICENLIITGDGTHGLGVAIYSDNCRVANCYFEKIKAGVFTSNSANNIIVENICQNNDNGINNYFGSDCIITGNVCSNNTIGIFNDRSTNSTIVENTCNHNERYGIFNYGSSDCTITGNACNGNNIDDVSDGAGIQLTDNCDYNTVAGNSCNNNANTGAGTAYGININTVDCNNNVIGVNSTQNNDVDYSDSGTGTRLFGDNTIYGISWDNDLGTATKNAIYDKMQLIIAGAAANAFKTINTPAGTNPVADAVDDTLNITATGDITITGNAGTDTVDFSVTKYTNVEAVNAVVAENPLALTHSLKIGGNDILDFGDNVILSSNGLGVIDALGNISCNIVFTGAQTVDGVDVSSIVAFKTITGITNNVVADLLTDTLTFAAVGGLTIVGTSATDTITFTNTITQYTDILAKAAVATDDKYIKNYENDSTTGDLTVANLITAGLVDGIDVSAIRSFKTITGITNDVVADNVADTLTLAAVGGLTIVGTAATDTITFTNTITQYTDGLAVAAVLADDKYIKNYESDVMGGDLTVNNLITAGNVDGVDVSALKTDVDGFNDQLKFLTQVEIQQLENIGAELISAAEWGFVASLQDVASGASPTFNRITINNIGTVNSDAVRYDQLVSMIAGLNWQESVLDNDLNAPPGGEGVGDRYIVAAGGAGAWNGHDDDIAEYNGVDWDFFTPEDGWTVWVVDEDTNFTWNGVAWVEFGSTISHNNTTGLQGGVAGEYFHLTNAQHGALHVVYTNVEAVNAVAAADDYIKNNANDVMNGDLTVNNLITAGNVDGVDVSSIVAFKTITGITNDVVADSLTDTLTFAAAGGLTIVGNAGTDTITFTNTITQYVDADAVAAVATADDYIKNDANDVMNGDLTVNNIITAGNVDGVDISALSITNMPTAVNNWKMYATNAGGVMTELAVGAAGQFLIGNGVAAAPSFQAQPAPIAHTHDTDTLQLDGINSNLGAFPFTTTGTVTFNQAVIIQGLLTADGLVPEGDLVDSLGTAALTWLNLYVQDIRDAAGNVILSNDGAGNIDALANLSCNIVFTGAQTVDGVDVSSIVAFKTITGITNDVVADSLTDTLTFAAAGGLTIVGNAGTDTITFTNTITQYTNGLAVAAIEAAGIDFDATKTLGFVDDVAGVFIDRIYDEDDMVSDDEHGLATQQSIKKYSDDRLYDIGFSHNWGGIVDQAPTVDKVYDQFIEIANEMTAIKYCLNFEGDWDATGGAPPDAAPADGDYWIVTTAGNWDGVDWELLDWIVWENNSEKWYKVKYFRQLPKVIVKSGDSIQTAIDKVIYMGGGTVEMQSATFNDADDAFPLNINDAGAGLFLRIVGIGISTIIDPNGDTKIFNITNIGRLVLEDFKIDITDYITANLECIDISEANDNLVIINNVTIVGDGTNGYGIEVNSNNCKIENCNISSVSIGINVLGNDNTVQGNVISSCDIYGVHITGNKNSLYDNESDSNAVGIYLDTGDYNQINGNYVEGNTLNGVYLTGSNYNAINDNYCIGNDSNTANPQAGIVIDADSDNNTIISNTSINNNNIGAGDGYGIYIGNVNCDKNIVRNNNISGNDVQWKDVGNNSDFEYRCSTWSDVIDAINSIAGKSGTIELLAGTFTVTATITINNATGIYYIKGQGDDTLITAAAAFNNPFIKIIGAKFCEISNMKVDFTCYTTDSGVDDVYAIWSWEASDNRIVFRDITVIGDDGLGIGLLHSGNNCDIFDCRGSGLTEGLIWIASDNGRIQNCTVTTVGILAGSIGIGSVGLGSTIIGCKAVGTFDIGIHAGAFYTVVEGCYCEGCDGEGFNINCNGASITGNVAKDCNDSFTITGDYNSISSNVVYSGTGTYGMYISGIYNSIIGNNVSNSVFSTYGIWMGAFYTMVTGNTIANNTYTVNGNTYAIMLGADKSNATGNVVINNTNTGGGTTFGLSVVGDDCIVGANQLLLNDTNYNDAGTGTVLLADDTVYGAGWDGDLGTATKNAIYNKIQLVIAGAAANAFATITGITNDVVADGVADTLTLAAAGGLTIVGNAGTDTITFTNTITQYTNAMVDARIVVQNTHPAGTIDIAIDALIATHHDAASADHDDRYYTEGEVDGLIAGFINAAGAVAAVLAADDYIKLGGDGITAGNYVLAQNATISFDAEQNDTTKAGIVIDIDTTGCNDFDLVYVDGNDSVLPADASDDTKMPAIGIVIAAGKVLISGVVKDDNLIVCTTGGAVVYASTTLRKVTETAPNGVGNMIQVVGVCVGDHTLYVNVSLDMVKFKA